VDLEECVVGKGAVDSEKELDAGKAAAMFLR
jgi:hypothetical protein